jgi:hypothetical protein
MAKSAIPDPLSRRHLLERELAPAQSLKIAEAYLAEGRALEAIGFLRNAGATERLLSLRRDAVALGDLFLLRMLAAATGREPEREEWLSLAEAADAAGKERYAAEARRYADRGED